MVLVPEGLAGVAAPPSANGEVQFDAPWELRVFTIATALAAQGTTLARFTGASD